jgi:hypothetical protein
LARWYEVVKATLSGISGTFYGRLLNPFKNSYLKPSDLAFTPRPAQNSTDLELNVDDLKNVFRPVLKKKIGDGAKFMSFSEAETEGYKCVGVNFFLLYCTWVKSTAYKTMWEKMSITQLGRDWPDASKAKDAAGELKNEDPLAQSKDDDDVRIVRISREKIIGTHDVIKRDRPLWVRVLPRYSAQTCVEMHTDN